VSQPVIVYDHPLSPYAQKVKIALQEKGVDFETRQPEALGSGSTAGDFAAASPRGEVPALIDGDTRVFDSSIILEYIEDRWPQPPLLPGSAADRARVRMLEDAMDSHFEAITWGLSELTYFGRATGALADTLRSAAGTQLAAWYQWLNQQLGQRQWFNGDTFGWGDLCVVPFVNGAIGFGHAPPADSALTDWLTRANARDSVSRCVEQAGRVGFDSGAVSMEAVREALEQGLFKREYRDHRLEWMIKSGGIEVVIKGLERDNIRFISPFA
jgi:glutathione S-transferase/RNA polymerase-associated protein